MPRARAPSAKGTPNPGATRCSSKEGVCGQTRVRSVGHPSQQPVARAAYLPPAPGPRPEGTRDPAVASGAASGPCVSVLGGSAQEPEGAQLPPDCSPGEPLIHTTPFTRNPSGPPGDFQAAACGWGQRQMTQRPKPECACHGPVPTRASAAPSRGSQAPPAPAAQQSMSSWELVAVPGSPGVCPLLAPGAGHTGTWTLTVHK